MNNREREMWSGFEKLGRSFRIGDHDPEPSYRDLSAFDVKKLEPTLEELKLLAISLQLGINKIETAVEFNSLACLRSSLRDLDDAIKGLPAMRENLEIIIRSVAP